MSLRICSIVSSKRHSNSRVKGTQRWFPSASTSKPYGGRTPYASLTSTHSAASCMMRQRQQVCEPRLAFAQVALDVPEAQQARRNPQPRLRLALASERPAQCRAEVVELAVQRPDAGRLGTGPDLARAALREFEAPQPVLYCEARRFPDSLPASRARTRDNDTWTEESWTRECDKSEALDNYSDWHESLLRLFAASERHYKWALYERDPLPAWTIGRTTLLGDAAHPMLPYLGQGAAQAIEDACVLATALSALPDDLAAALRLYERSRLARTTRVLLGARARGAGDQTPSRWVALKRNALIALRSRFGSDRTGRNFAWLYEYDAGSADALVQAAKPARR